ncbi:hypothetical protein BJ508DRAFT_18140 [Ascobolus immersus RN42]|uniref:Uncharacterized protein n=1 Tax=Ascobolus immersus RN42 TaxID=1160509 RepID=A0A3N4I107_ASCIM|nr:hypothetical protein BJ508DRAFT_18140 [Ascobolus immersus RN42]
MSDPAKVAQRQVGKTSSGRSQDAPTRGAKPSSSGGQRPEGVRPAPTNEDLRTLGFSYPLPDCLTASAGFIPKLKEMVRCHLIGPDLLEPTPPGASRDAILRIDRDPKLHLQHVHLLLLFKKSPKAKERSPDSNFEAYVLNFIYPYLPDDSEAAQKKFFEDIKSVRAYNQEALRRKNCEHEMLDTIWKALKHRHEDAVYEDFVPPFLPRPDRYQTSAESAHFNQLWASHGKLGLLDSRDTNKRVIDAYYSLFTVGRGFKTDNPIRTWNRPQVSLAADTGDLSDDFEKKKSVIKMVASFQADLFELFNDQESRLNDNVIPVPGIGQVGIERRNPFRIPLEDTDDDDPFKFSRPVVIREIAGGVSPQG